MEPATFVATVKMSGKTTKLVYIPKAVVDTMKLRHGQNINVTITVREDK